MRYPARSPYSKDSSWQREGDLGWIGIDMIHAESDRAAVQPGFLARAENKRLRTRASVKRAGTILPEDFNPSGFTPPSQTSYIVGSGVFANPNAEEQMLVAEAGKTYVWALQFGKTPFKINYSQAEINTGRTNGTGAVEFVQYFEKVGLKRRT